jgi:hypothetical protein
MNVLLDCCRTGDPGADWDLLQRLSFSSPEAFWPHLLQLLGVRFHSPPHRYRHPWVPVHLRAARSAQTCACLTDCRMLELHLDPDRVCWLPGARFNIAECALSGAERERPAVVWADEAEPTTLRRWSLGELAGRSAHVADALRSSGLEPGGDNWLA